jgi:hypothetical protein
LNGVRKADYVAYTNSGISVEDSQNLLFITTNICHVYLANRKTKYYNNIAIHVLLVQSVTYTCQDLEGSGLSFVEYFSEECSSSSKYSHLRLIYKTVHKKDMRSVFL